MLLFALLAAGCNRDVSFTASSVRAGLIEQDGDMLPVLVNARLYLACVNLFAGVDKRYAPNSRSVSSASSRVIPGLSSRSRRTAPSYATLIRGSFRSPGVGKLFSVVGLCSIPYPLHLSKSPDPSSTLRYFTSCENALDDIRRCLPLAATLWWVGRSLVIL